MSNQDNLKREITRRLIAAWDRNADLVVGVPYRRMATEAAEIIADFVSETEAENAELRAVLGAVMQWIDDQGDDFQHDGEWETIADNARAVLKKA